MASRFGFQLTSSRPSMPVNLEFEAVCVVVTNLTASDIVIRQGANEIPSIATADIIVPAASQSSYAAVGKWFGVGFADAGLVDMPADPIESGLAGTATVLFLGAGETIPTLGSVAFQSLSASELTNGLTTFAGTTVSAIFDLGPWGGAIVHVSPDSGSGQGILTIAVASAAAGPFRTFQTLAFWRGLPLTAMVPRVARFLRVTLTATTIAGEPAMTGSYAVRATLAEIARFDYQVTGASISNAYNVPNLSETSYILATYGLPSITVALRETGGTGFYGQIIVETATAAAGPWTFVTTREQNVSVGTLNASMYRTLGTLGPYTRVRLLNNGVAGALIGTIEFSIQATQDLAGVLHDLYRAIGDTGEPVNVGQSVYSLLKQIDATLDLYQPGLSWLPLIETDTTNIDTKLGSIDSKILAFGTSSLYATQQNIAAGNNNVMINSGVDIPANSRIITAQLAYKITGTLVSNECFADIWIGTPAAAATPLVAFQGRDVPTDFSPEFNYSGGQSWGFTIPSGVQRLWFRSSQTPCTITPMLVYKT